MAPEIDLTRGGYGGDVVEETFKPFTATNMEYWWHFREVLLASTDKDTAYWRRVDGQPMSDDEHRELIALSLTNYAVYTNFADGLAFFEELSFELSRFTAEASRLANVRRAWKAMYSSLYSSLNALSNIVCVVVAHKPRFEIKPSGEVWNYTPRRAHNLMQSRGFNTIAVPLKRCIDRMVIRDQLDHYGLIWHSITRGNFFIDSNFTKGSIPVSPANEVKIDLNAYEIAHEDLLGCARDFNLVYKELSVTDGYLDKYLQKNGWEIDYSSFGEPHNQKRPLP